MNRVLLIGRLTKKPELDERHETPMTKFTIAVDRRSKDKGADFIRITAFGKQAENVCRFKDKGHQIAVEGRIQTGSYEKDGARINTFDVIADSIEFLGSNPEQRTTDRSYHTYGDYSEPPADYRRFEEPLF